MKKHPAGADYRRPPCQSSCSPDQPGLCPKRARIVSLYTDPPAGATILSVDELGPVSPRTLPPAPLDYGRGPDKVWIYGAMRIHDSQTRTQTAPSRDTAGFTLLLDAVD